MPNGGVSIFKHRGLRRGEECVWSFASLFFNNFSPAFNLRDTVRQCWRGGHTPSGHVTLDRFPPFPAMGLKRPYIGIQVTPKTAEIDQTRPSFRASLTRSRSCTICNHQQSTLGPLIIRRMRKVETRDRGLKTGGGTKTRDILQSACFAARAFAIGDIRTCGLGCQRVPLTRF